MRPSVAQEALEFARTVRPSHSLFALPFAVGAAFLAERPYPEPGPFALILACMVTARTAAMGMNRFLDARLDARNPRTATRPIPAGRLRRGTALVLALLSGAAFVACAWGFWPLRENIWPGLLAPAFLAVLLSYSPTKRFTVLTHWVLGLCLGLAPVGAWIALRGRLGPLPVLLGAAVMFWTAGFDILYAIQDTEFDRREGLKSIPARYGLRWGLRMALGCHLLAFFLLGSVIGFDVFEKVLLGEAPAAQTRAMGLWSVCALATIALLIAAQHLAVRRIRKERIPVVVFPLNALVAIIWMLGVMMDLVPER